MRNQLCVKLRLFPSVSPALGAEGVLAEVIVLLGPVRCLHAGAQGREARVAPLSVCLSCAVSSQNLTYEIILTLGQAFEVAYQLALQAQKSRPVGASAAEMIETKSSKPVPKPRVGMRKSAVRGPPRTPHALG